MHEYEKADIGECLRGRRLVFIGDSTVRQVFWAVASKMGRHTVEVEPLDAFALSHAGSDIEFESAGVTARFIWDPWLNSTGLEQELNKYEAQPLAGDRGDSAAFMLLGAPGLWYARYGKQNYFREFRQSIDRVIPYMDHVTTRNDTQQSKQPGSRDKSPNLLLLSPVQVPAYRALTPTEKATLTFDRIQMMNEYLNQASAYSSADVVWSYSSMTGMNRGEYEVGGLHLIQSVARRKADVLLNLRCNSDAATKGYPYNRTCCNNYKRPNGVQRAIILLALFVLPGLLLLRRKHVLKPGLFLPPAEVCSALSTFALVVCFCFFADRTQLFEKANSQFQMKLFVGLCQAVAVGGVLSIKRVRPLVVTHVEVETTGNNEYLSQDQIDEWKGWVVAGLLIYHYTGASDIMLAYKTARVLTASYLFITAYDHTLSFLTRSDYSLQRVATVLLHLNLLSSILSYMMRTENKFYYLPPLLSFWFVINYLVLRIGNEHNSSLNFIFAKAVLSAILTTACIMIPGTLELISTALQRSCGMTWDVQRWRSSTSLDMYIPYAGMILAILCHRLSQLNSGSSLAGHSIDSLLRFIKSQHALFQNVAILASVILLAIFWSGVRRLPEKDDYNQWHPYISWIPIISILALRTSHSYLRNIHSRAFTWLGRCSLELYVLQYHIWLAADGSGLLRIGLWNRWAESAILTLVFLWVCSRAAYASTRLTAWVIGCDVPPGDGGWHEKR